MFSQPLLVRYLTFWIVFQIFFPHKKARGYYLFTSWFCIWKIFVYLSSSHSVEIEFFLFVFNFLFYFIPQHPVLMELYFSPSSFLLLHPHPTPLLSWVPFLFFCLFWSMSEALFRCWWSLTVSSYLRGRCLGYGKEAEGPGEEHSAFPLCLIPGFRTFYFSVWSFCGSIFPENKTSLMSSFSSSYPLPVRGSGEGVNGEGPVVLSPPLPHLSWLLPLQELALPRLLSA